MPVSGASKSGGKTGWPPMAKRNHSGKAAPALRLMLIFFLEKIESAMIFRFTRAFSPGISPGISGQLDFLRLGRKRPFAIEFGNQAIDLLKAGFDFGAQGAEVGRGFAGVA